MSRNMSRALSKREWDKVLVSATSKESNVAANCRCDVLPAVQVTHHMLPASQYREYRIMNAVSYVQDQFCGDHRHPAEFQVVVESEDC